MEEKVKKPYVKPMIIFENYITGELTGSPEMIDQLMAEVKTDSEIQECPLSHIVCP